MGLGIWLISVYPKTCLKEGKWYGLVEQVMGQCKILLFVFGAYTSFHKYLSSTYNVLTQALSLPFWSLHSRKEKKPTSKKINTVVCDMYNEINTQEAR